MDLDIQHYLDHGDQFYMNNISIDIVIFGYQDGKLKVLLSEINGKWALQGGYIGRKESVGDAAARLIEERTGSTTPFLKLFKIFGDKDRNFGEEFKSLVSHLGYQWKPEQWINGRFITIAYFAFVDIERTKVKGGTFLTNCGWHSIDNLPVMLLDHRNIIKELKLFLKQELSYNHIAQHLLPEQFTLPQLRAVYETILEKKLDRSRFQQKMLSLGIYERLPQLNKKTRGRNPYLYRFKGEVKQ